jgi:hypothetical protein
VTLHEPYEDAVHQYVAGTLPADELDEFEQHLLTCETCRSAVQAGAAARTALVAQPFVRTAPMIRTRRAPLIWAGAVAAAAVIAVLATRSSGDPLGRVSPAPFVAGALRPSAEPSTALVDSGMTAYVASDFGAAAERLGRAALTDSSVSVAFYLGVSLLMVGEDAAALDALGRSAAGPYAGESAYYMAKALIRQHHRDSAIAVLERASLSTPELPMIRAFADSIRRR